MVYDYSRLLGRIVEKYGTQAKFAEALDTSERTVSLKLNNKIGWKQDEIERSCQLLEIPHIDIPSYFFAQAVQS